MSKVYSISAFAERIGKSKDTLRRWDREGTLVPKRHASGHRYYTEDDVRKVFQCPVAQKKVIVYSRVSSNNQKEDLASQEAALQTFCIGAGIAVDDWVSEVGSGLNFKRPKFLNLIDQIQRGEIKQLIIAHKDRLCRFGFEYVEHIAQQNDCQITIMNQIQLSPQQEMVEDLLAVVRCFSSRLYGLRKYKKVITEAVKEVENA